MAELEIVHNKRKAHCSDCHRLLLPGEGIQHEMPWFHGNNPIFYLCERCDGIRKTEAKAGSIDTTVRRETGFAGGSSVGKKMR
jgi:RNase P subunit RPR2